MPWCGAMNHGVSPHLQADQHQRRHCHGNLKAFRPLFSATECAPPPPRGLPGPQMPGPSQDRQVDHRTDDRNPKHRNPDGVLVESTRGRVDPADRCQRRQPDSNPHSADRKYSGAQALNHRQEKAGAGDSLEPGRRANGRRCFLIRFFFGKHPQPQITPNLRNSCSREPHPGFRDDLRSSSDNWQLASESDWNLRLVPPT